MHLPSLLCKPPQANSNLSTTYHSYLRLTRQPTGRHPTWIPAKALVAVHHIAPHCTPWRVHGADAVQRICPKAAITEQCGLKVDTVVVVADPGCKHTHVDHAMQRVSRFQVSGCTCSTLAADVHDKICKFCQHGRATGYACRRGWRLLHWAVLCTSACVHARRCGCTPKSSKFQLQVCCLCMSLLLRVFLTSHTTFFLVR